MKSIKILNTFQCDNCLKKSKEIEEGKGFPYSDGWRFLYNLEFKMKNSDSVKSREKHFCCDACMVNFIKDRILTSRN